AAGCGAGQILVVAGLLERDLPCLVFDERRLRETGAVALYFEGDELKMKTARESTGRRLWNTR
ncbi:MAG: competence protein, partial [Lentibacter algarum]|nr:competence protein [Lentibacter algarum]